MRAGALFLFAMLSTTPALGVGIRSIDAGGFAWGGPIALDSAGNLMLLQWDGVVHAVAPDGSGSDFGEPNEGCNPLDILVAPNDAAYIGCYEGVIAYGPPPARTRTLVTPQWGSEVEEAAALALGPSGELWVAAANGLFRWDGTTATRVDEFAASGVAVGANGDVIYSHGWSTLERLPAGGGPPVRLLDPTGAGLGKPLGSPTRVAVGFGGEAFVVGSMSNNVLRVDPSGIASEVIDARGDGDGFPFFLPSAIAADGTDGFVVAGGESDVVLRVAADGTTSMLIDDTGDGAHGMDGPIALAVDAQGAVWVVDSDRNVFRVLPNGSVTRVFDASGIAGVQLGVLRAIAIHPTGAAFVCDNYGSIFTISPSGARSVVHNSWQEVTNLSGARELVFDTQGRILVAALDSLVRRELDGTWTTLLDSALVGPWGVSGVSVGPAGDVFAIGRYTLALYRVAPDDTVTEVPVGPVFSYFDSDLVAHADGSLSLLGKGRVWTRTADGALSIRWDAPPEHRPYLIASDSSGVIGLASIEGGVFFLDAVNQATQRLDATGIGSGNRMQYPVDLAIGLDGSLYVAAAMSRNVFRVTPRGEIRLAMGPDGDGAGHPLESPSRLAVSPDGAIYVSHLAPTVLRIAPPQCGDARDNDGDGGVDRLDPDCAHGDFEQAVHRCGLGGELALVLPALYWARANARRRRGGDILA